MAFRILGSRSSDFKEDPSPKIKSMDNMNKTSMETKQEEQPLWKTLLNSAEDTSGNLGVPSGEETGKAITGALGSVKHAAVPIVRPLVRAATDIAATPAGLTELGLSIPRWTLQGGRKVIDLMGGDKDILPSPESIPTYKELQKKGGAGNPLKWFPTQDQWQGALESIIGEDFSPKTEGQKNFDDAFSTFTALSLGKIPFKASAAIIGAGQAAKYGSKAVGLSKDSQEVAKVIGEIGTSLIAHKYNIGKSFDKRYEKVNNLIDRNTSIPANNLYDKAILMKAEIDKHKVGVPEYEGLSNKINELIKENIKTEGTSKIINVDDALRFKQSINKIYGLNKEGKKRFKALGGIVKESIKEGTQKAHPEYWKALDETDKLFGAYHDSSSISNMLSDNKELAAAIKNEPLKYILGGFGALGGGYGAYKGVGGPIAIAAGVTAGFSRALSKAVKFIVKDPTARTEFLNIMKAGKAGVASAVAKYGTKLSDRLNKEQSFENYRILGNKSAYKPA